jgi:radical SAM/Cys-rich protein
MKNSTFQQRVSGALRGPLRSLELATLQVNLGYRCNLTCKHCHVACAPSRTESMDRDTADAVLRALESGPADTIDLTGGSPELNPHFRRIVREAHALSKKVIVRTNLAIVHEEGMADLPCFYRDHNVEVVASLPYYVGDDVDRVRGSGTFVKCIAVLRQFYELGYGHSDGGTLNLVYNPRGAFLSPDQTCLEAEYRRELGSRFGVSFTRLFTFNNMPIGRFRDFLRRTGNLEAYQSRLVAAFNPDTLDGVMCRHLLSVGWDGGLYDCDFNQALGLSMCSGLPKHIRDFDGAALEHRDIETDEHCFGCTAGAGSS